jgi:hypothetical protein
MRAPSVFPPTLGPPQASGRASGAGMRGGAGRGAAAAAAAAAVVAAAAVCSHRGPRGPRAAVRAAAAVLRRAAAAVLRRAAAAAGSAQRRRRPRCHEHHHYQHQAQGCPRSPRRHVAGLPSAARAATVSSVRAPQVAAGGRALEPRRASRWLACSVPQAPCGEILRSARSL